METIKVKTLRATDSFIAHLFDDFPSDDFPTYFIPSFERFYFGHSGNKRLGGMAVSELDEYSLTDDEGNLVEVDDGFDETGVIDEFSSWYEDIGKTIGDMHYGKWHSVFVSLQKAYGKDFYDLDSMEEKITNDLTDRKEFSHSKNTKTATSLTTTNTKNATDSTSTTGTTTSNGQSDTTEHQNGTRTPDITTTATNSVSAFNETGFANSDKTETKQTGTEKNDDFNTGHDESTSTSSTEGKNDRTINDTTTITAVGNADENHSDSSDSGNDTITHEGTRTRSVNRTGGNDVWRRAEEYNRYVSVNLFREMANDIDKVITLPFYM